MINRFSRIEIKTKFEDIEEIAKEIAKIKNVKAVYLFGSYATGKIHPLSDIDICVITNKKVSYKTEMKIMGYVTDNLDISIFYMLPIAIRFRVFKEGKPLIVKDREFVNLVKFKTLQEYLDFKPLINRYIWETLGVKNV